ncbi:hypothetical protein EDD21DRAFT_433197 [Dissophora ornata]|nr:hypothetical protein EDD21DRAFT_433197 [Dissophora ornata]
MNILPHKSWHVYNQKNRDKVRRDEAKAEEEEKQTNDRAIAADREHRLTVLRQRAQKRLSNNLGDEQSEQDRDQGQSTVGPPVPEDTKAVTVAAQHVNFWSDLEQHDTKSRQGNPENEAEVKAKKEKWDRTVAMHLDTGVKGQSPWYTSKHAGSMTTSRRKEDANGFSKTREDPLNLVKKMLDKRERVRRDKSRSPSPDYRTKRPERPRKRETLPSSESKGVQMSTMDRLRKERLEREKAEKAKARALLNPNYVDPNEHHRPTGAYSQQFNPQATSLAHSSHSKSFHEDKPQGRGRMERDDYNRDRNQERGRDRNGDSALAHDPTSNLHSWVGSHSSGHTLSSCARPFR